jgi:ubiquinone/menaquinone biosynthesis C-methylase UbiE
MSKKHQEAIREQFSKTADAFSKFGRDSPEVVAEKVEFSKPQPTDVALDVACGPGAFVLALSPRVRMACGIDLTYEMLRRARQFQLERAITNTPLTRGDAEQLPYPDGVFDMVSCQQVFHHLPKPQLVLQEMARVMKSEGRILIVDHLAPESDAKFELFNRIERVRDPSHAASLRLTKFLEMFDECGLDLVRQSIRRRQRLFNDWMRRAGLAPGDKQSQEARKLLEDSIAGDQAGSAPQAQGDDILFVHNEAMFLLVREPEQGASLGSA